MDTAVIVALIGAMQAVGVAVIGGMITRTNNQRKARDVASDAREKRREERDLALYGLLFANTDGTEVLLHQAHGDHLNGNVEDALRSIRDAKQRFNEVCNKEVAKL